MMTVDYYSTPQYTASTMSSETLSGSCGSRNSRIRKIRLARPIHGTLPPPGLTFRHGPSLGFSIRGGREHGTGFFVSHVEAGSEAHRQGLRVGDQIIRVNGFTIEDAVHKELLQLISNHTHVTLKVRSVGMIPVKDKRTDALSWQIISDGDSSLSSSPPLGEKNHDVRINMMVAPRSKLGCGICKGPEWKPGIFVQFTKDAGIAREAGLRPGDQILYCNGVDFNDVPFNEAVNIMKTSRQLDLVVRKSAGSELFPGESSGYNSSASSVTGDQSPSWADSKRLSIVKEESMDLEDRLTQLDRLKNKKWEKIAWDDDEEKPTYKPTIINLSENGITIKNNGVDEMAETFCSNEAKLADICMVSQHLEKKTVVVEVHRSDVEEKPKTDGVVKSSSATSFSSCTTGASDACSSLSSAISLELQRRTEKQKTQQNKPTIDEQIQMRKILKGVDTEKQQQHTKLMDEFKKAHRKMFKGEEKPNELVPSDRHSTKPLVERLSSYEAPQERSTTTAMKRSISASPMHPPPPPPLPSEETAQSPPPPSATNTLNKPKKPKAPPVPIKTSTLSTFQPPPCPTPDYDNLSINSSNSTLTRKQYTSPKETVEMESLESIALEHPNTTVPNPPSTYFTPKAKLGKQLSNGSTSSATSTMRKQQRPVSVTIGEYPSGTLRKQPGRFEFLNGSGDEVDGKGGNQPITSQLASELAQTLNRSNLRRRTESMENLLNGSHIKPQSNGGVRISVNNNANKKSGHNLSAEQLENLSKVFGKMEASPNGILKNGRP